MGDIFFLWGERLFGFDGIPLSRWGGEDLPSVALDERGISRDRWFAVRDSEGHFASGKNTRRFRRHDEVFQYSAATTSDDVRVTHGDGGSWHVGDPDLDAHLSENMGEPVTVSAEQTVPHQDMGSLSLIGTATLQWCANQWGLNADPRRLRVNIVLETSEPFIEESWVGCSASLGAAGLDFVKKIPRCRMIDINQDGAEATGGWLKSLALERDMSIGVYAIVTNSGRIHVGEHINVCQS